MPDPAVAAPAAPAATPVPASIPAPSPSPSPAPPSGGRPPDSKPADGAAPDTKAPETPEADLKFDFGFEGETPDIPAEPAAEGDFDVSRPFDTRLEEKLKDVPELSRAVKKLWYENRAFRSSGFKTAQEAQNHLRDLNTLVQDLGRTDGKTGLEAVKAQMADWTAIESGDEAVISRTFDALQPESADKVATANLRAWEKKNPGGWSREMARVFMNELRANNPQGQNILSALNRIANIAGGVDNPELKAAVNTIAEAVNQLDEIARKAPDAPKAPDQREQQLSQRERSIFVKELSSSVMPQIGSSAEKAARVVLNGAKLEPDAFKKFAERVQGEYIRLCKQDKVFQKNIHAALEAGDNKAFERIVQSKITRTMPEAAKNMNKERRLLAGGDDRRAEAQSRVETAAGGSQTGGMVRYAGKLIQGGPDPAVVDWARMRQVTGSRKAAEDMFFDRKFFVKGDARNTYTW